jgi:hypothetical protein
MVSPKNGSSVSQAISKTPSAPLHSTADSVPFFAPEPRHLADMEADGAVLDQLAHALDAVGRGAEFVAPVQSVRLLATGCRLRTQSSAESPPPTISTSRPRNASILRTE